MPMILSAIGLPGGDKNHNTGTREFIGMGAIVDGTQQAVAQARNHPNFAFGSDVVTR